MDSEQITNEELFDFFSRPRQPILKLPEYTPFGPLERILHQVHEPADDRLAEFHRDLFLHLLHVAVVAVEGGTPRGVQYEGAAWRPFVRHDGKVLLFSSLDRAYDGLPELPPPPRPVASGRCGSWCRWRVGRDSACCPTWPGTTSCSTLFRAPRGGCPGRRWPSCCEPTWFVSPCLPT